MYYIKYKASIPRYMPNTTEFQFLVTKAPAKV